MAVSQAKPSNPRAKKANPKPEFACDYCKKSFSRESTLLVHMCERKRRIVVDQESKHVKLAFSVFQRFHEINYKGRKPKTFESFAESQLYGDFIRFGRYLLNLNAIDPKAFVDFLIKTEVKINKWQTPSVYETYIRELNKKETPMAAIQRNFMLMEQWANDTGENWIDFFRKIGPAQATLWIKSGRISPWILFTASSAAELFARLSDEQLELVQQNIDPDFWRVKLSRAKDDVDFIRAQLDEAGL